MEELWNVLQLRNVGGKYYLIDNANASQPYHKPIVIDKMGANFFSALQGAGTRKAAAELIAARYGADASKVMEDMEVFLDSVKERYAAWK